MLVLLVILQPVAQILLLLSTHIYRLPALGTAYRSVGAPFLRVQASSGGGNNGVAMTFGVSAGGLGVYLSTNPLSCNTQT